MYLVISNMYLVISNMYLVISNMYLVISKSCSFTCVGVFSLLFVFLYRDTSFCLFDLGPLR